jgi:hypothetical protein
VFACLRRARRGRQVLDNRELVDGEPVVVVRVGEIKQSRLCAANGSACLPRPPRPNFTPEPFSTVTRL